MHACAGMSDQSPSYAQGSWVARGYEMDKYIRLSNPPFKSLRVIPNTTYEWGPVQDLYTTWNVSWKCGCVCVCVCVGFLAPFCVLMLGV